jgi:hypothetical protein
MTSGGLLPAITAVFGILLLSTLAGRATTVALVPEGPRWNLEQWGWSMASALLLLTVPVCFSFVAGIRPGWIPFLLIAGSGAALARRFRFRQFDVSLPKPAGRSPVTWLLLALTAAGVATYTVVSLEEPLASNDYFAIWGLKGKSIFGDAAIPRRLFDWPEYAFSNPAYPIGLPLLYAGIAFLLGRWDDHAMALLFPFFQLATLLVLAGWLKRRGAPPRIALAATAVVANFAYLYSPVMTGGMAEVPASFTFLLVGVAFCDCLDNTDAGCRRRLALAALLAAPAKNEGLFFLGTAFALLLLESAWRRGRPRWRTAVAIAVPGLVSLLVHRLVLGRHALRAFDFGLLWRPGFAGLLWSAFREAFVQLVVPFWPALAALAVLIIFAGKTSQLVLLLALAGSSLAVYLVLPAFCTFGPAWLVHWTVGRITAALAPLAAAGIAAGWGYSDGQPSLNEVNQPVAPLTPVG